GGGGGGGGGGGRGGGGKVWSFVDSAGGGICFPGYASASWHFCSAPFSFFHCQRRTTNSWKSALPHYTAPTHPLPSSRPTNSNNGVTSCAWRRTSSTPSITTKLR